MGGKTRKRKRIDEAVNAQHDWRWRIDVKASRMKGRERYKKMDKRSQNRPSYTKKSVVRRSTGERKHELAEQNRGFRVGSIRARWGLAREGPYETKRLVIYRITVPDGKNTVQMEFGGDAELG